MENNQQDVPSIPTFKNGGRLVELDEKGLPSVEWVVEHSMLGEFAAKRCVTHIEYLLGQIFDGKEAPHGREIMSFLVEMYEHGVIYGFCKGAHAMRKSAIDGMEERNSRHLYPKEY